MQDTVRPAAVTCCCCTLCLVTCQAHIGQLPLQCGEHALSCCSSSPILYAYTAHWYASIATPIAFESLITICLLCRWPGFLCGNTCAGVLGIRITSRDAASPQPCVGIVDCGASFSAVNWAAARLLGLTDAAGNLRGKKGPDILSLGVDGRPVPYPTTSVSFSFAGASCCLQV